MGHPAVLRIDAAASWNPDHVPVGRVSVLVDNLSPDRLTILAHDSPDQVDHHPAAKHASRLDLSSHVLLPGLINAHTHLDLTHLGPHVWDPTRPFSDWVAIIRAGRLSDAAQIATSVRAGAALSRAGGTVLVGDIAGAVRGEPSLAAAHALASTGLAGVSFIEFFAIGTRMRENLDLLAATLAECSGPVNPGTPSPGLHLGLQPHATNTVAPDAYLHALALAGQRWARVCTHLAESPEERQFIRDATGPQRALLEQVGVWDEALLATFGLGHHPVEHMAPILRLARDAGNPMLVAHVNDATDNALEILAQTRTSVAYCPRASAYFGAHHHFGPHRYQAMLHAGINVCLGTDSVVNITDGTLVPSSGSPARLSILDEMRLLHQRDAADPVTLLRMATTNAARALGLDPTLVTLSPGSTPLEVLGIPIPPAQIGLAAVRTALSQSSAPISILTRILPVSQQ